MKNQIKSIAASLMAILFISASSFAYSVNDSKAVQKAKNAVEQASPDDWKTLEKSAKICINKNQNMKEAVEWLDASIAIKTTSSNLELKGDYYAKVNLPKKALEQYVASSKMLKEQNATNSTAHLEIKIAAMSKM